MEGGQRFQSPVVHILETNEQKLTRARTVTVQGDGERVELRLYGLAKLSGVTRSDYG